MELPMTAEMDNSGAGDIANSRSIGGKSRHIHVMIFSLCELKDDKIIAFKHSPGDDNMLTS